MHGTILLTDQSIGRFIVLTAESAVFRYCHFTKATRRCNSRPARCRLAPPAGSLKGSDCCY